MSRKCTKCGEEKDENEFYDKKVAGNICKVCRRLLLKIYRQNKKTEKQELMKKPFDEVLADITETKRSLNDATVEIIKRLEAVLLGQKDVQIKLRDLELKLERNVAT
jgi:hypothetical protein